MRGVKWRARMAVFAAISRDWFFVESRDYQVESREYQVESTKSRVESTRSRLIKDRTLLVESEQYFQINLINRRNNALPRIDFI